MENLYIAATPSSPEVDFRFDQHLLSLKGESYPENAASFYGQINKALEQYLDHVDSYNRMTLNVDLTYFNSSSTKMLFTLFGVLESKARDGMDIVVNWYHDSEDEMTQEFGEEMRDDFSGLDFRIHAIDK